MDSSTGLLSRTSKRLLLIKSVHSVVFFFMWACLLYILYVAVSKTYDWLLVVAIGFILVEGAALLFNRFQCPLTTLARKYGADKGSVADIFLPAWCARNNFQIATTLFVIELVLLGFGYFMR